MYKRAVVLLPLECVSQKKAEQNGTTCADAKHILSFMLIARERERNSGRKGEIRALRDISFLVVNRVHGWDSEAGVASPRSGCVSRGEHSGEP